MRFWRNEPSNLGPSIVIGRDVNLMQIASVVVREVEIVEGHYIFPFCIPLGGIIRNSKKPRGPIRQY